MDSPTTNKINQLQPPTPSTDSRQSPLRQAFPQHQLHLHHHDLPTLMSNIDDDHHQPDILSFVISPTTNKSNLHESTPTSVTNSQQSSPHHTNILDDNDDDDTFKPSQYVPIFARKIPPLINPEFGNKPIFDQLTCLNLTISAKQNPHNRKLSPKQIMLMGLGPGFRFGTPEAPEEEWLANMDKLTNTVARKLRTNFDINKSRASKLPKFWTKSPFWQPEIGHNEDIEALITDVKANLDAEIERLRPRHRRLPQILHHSQTVKDQQALTDVVDSLTTDEQILMEGDKGVGWVLLELKWYIAKVMKLLADETTYRYIGPALNTDELIQHVNNQILTICRILHEHGNLYHSPSKDAQPEILLFNLERYGISILHNYHEHLTVDAKFILQRPLDTAIGYAINSMRGLPKIHKEVPNISDPPLRPIIPNFKSATHFLSRWLHLTLVDLTLTGRLYLKDTTTLIDLIKDFQKKNEVTADTVLSVTDIESLYPSMIFDKVFQKLDNWIRRMFTGIANCKSYNVPLSERQQAFLETFQDGTKTSFILSALKHVLENNYIEFNGQLYLQITGTAMGTSVAVALANLYLSIIEEDVLDEMQAEGLDIPALLRRFIDDWFAISANITIANNFFSRLSIAYKAEGLSMKADAHREVQHTYTEAIVLDIIVSIEQEPFIEPTIYCIHTRSYRKPVKANLYLAPSSHHPTHIYLNIILGLLKKARRVNSKSEYFEDERRTIRRMLEARGYNPAFISYAFDLDENKNADPTAELKYIIQHQHTDNRAKQRIKSIINRRHPGSHFWTSYDPRSARINWSKIGKLDHNRKRLPSYAAEIVAKHKTRRPRATTNELTAITNKAHTAGLKRAQNVFGNALDDLHIHVGLPDNIKTIVSKRTNHQLRIHSKKAQSILRYIKDQEQHPTHSN